MTTSISKVSCRINFLPDEPAHGSIETKVQFISLIAATETGESLVTF